MLYAQNNELPITSSSMKNYYLLLPMEILKLLQQGYKERFNFSLAIRIIKKCQPKLPVQLLY